MKAQEPSEKRTAGVAVRWTELTNGAAMLAKLPQGVERRIVGALLA